MEALHLPEHVQEAWIDQAAALGEHAARTLAAGNSSRHPVQ